MAPPTKTILFPHHPLSPKPRLDLCSSACNPTQNFFRFCPPLCIPLCPAFCQPLPGFLHSPQPPPSVPTTGTDYRPHPHPHRHHDYLSPVFITMIILLASSFVLAVSYFIYFAFFSRSPLRRLRSNRRRVMEYDRTMEVMNFHPVWYIATVGLQRSTIDSIAVCSYKKGDGLVQEVTCPICLAEFQERDALRLLPKCCHAFHVPCIDTWLESHTNCPVCRASVLQANTNPQPQEARVVEIAQDPSSSGEVRGEFEGVEALRPMRRAASMDSLCAELGEKMDTSSSGVNSLGERSLSCTGNLFSSSRNGFR